VISLYDENLKCLFVLTLNLQKFSETPTERHPSFRNFLKHQQETIHPSEIF